MKNTLTGVLCLMVAVGIAGCAGQTAIPEPAMLGAISTQPRNASSGTSNASTTVVIVAPRPATQTPWLLSFDGLSLASPLAEADAPSQPPIPNSYFGGGGGMPHKLLLGSAPSPTPDDLCVYGSDGPHCYTDSSRKERRHFIADPMNPGHFREVRPGDEKIVENQIRTEKLIRQSLFWLEK